MILIRISTDRNIFVDDSLVQKRILSYGKFFELMKVVVFTGRGSLFQRKYFNQTVEVIPTRSISRWLYVLDAIRIVRQEIKIHTLFEKIMISCQDPFETGLVGYLVSQITGVSLHVEIHTDIGSSYFKKHSLLNRARLLIANLVLKKAKRIRVVSPQIKKYLVEEKNIDPEKIDVLPIVDNFPSLQRQESTEKYALVVSRLEKEKRVGDAIIAFSKIYKKYPGLKLKIAGEGRELETLTSLSKDLGVGDSVDFLGNVSNTPSLYAGANCLLHTSEYEGFGLVLYEAFKSGCPIVSTKVGIAIDIEKTGYPVHLCDVGDTECLVKSIPSYLEHFYAEEGQFNLDFVPQNYDIYLDKYHESIEKAFA